MPLGRIEPLGRLDPDKMLAVSCLGHYQYLAIENGLWSFLTFVGNCIRRGSALAHARGESHSRNAANVQYQVSSVQELERLEEYCVCLKKIQQIKGTKVIYSILTQSLPTFACKPTLLSVYANSDRFP